MKTRLKVPWCVKNDNSQLFKDTVIKYLNENYNGNYNGLTYSFYGVKSNNEPDYFCNTDLFGSSVTLYSIDEFIELSKPINQTINGKADGYWENFYDNGKLLSKGNYKEGKVEGYWEYYNDNGILLSKGNYKNGKREGYWERHYDNGNITFKGTYKDDLMNGYWEYYDYNGNIRNKENYINGINYWIKEDKKIIGYKCPMDLFKGRIKKGSIFSIYSPNKFVMYNIEHMTSGIPTEIVETWEPVYETEDIIITIEGHRYKLLKID